MSLINNEAQVLQRFAFCPIAARRAARRNIHKHATPLFSPFSQLSPFLFLFSSFCSFRMRVA
jgi:hypothetical protein